MCYSRFSAINSRPLEFITRSSAAPTSGLRGWATSSWRGDNNKQDFRSNSVTPASLTNRTQHYQQRRLLWTWTGRQLQQHASWGSKNGELQTSNSSRNNTEHQQQTTNNRWAKINIPTSGRQTAMDGIHKTRHLLCDKRTCKSITAANISRSAEALTPPTLRQGKNALQADYTTNSQADANNIRPQQLHWQLLGRTRRNMEVNNRIQHHIFKSNNLLRK